ncbi:Reducing polyketide synthase FUB1 [Metarhizium anisopliae]|nr:Reducing polyketide synthase FUB1 [Metarhizium anisopliae]
MLRLVVENIGSCNRSTLAEAYNPVERAIILDEITQIRSSGRRAGRKATVKWDALLEVGPHAALKAPLVQIMESIDAKLPSELLYTCLLVRKEDAVTTALKAVGSLWATGIPILLAKVNREQDLVESPQVVVDLPCYAWNHERVYWHETPATKVSPSTTYAAFVRHSA